MYSTSVHKFIHFLITWFLVKIQNSNQTKRTKLENVCKEIETRYKKAAGLVTRIYQRNEAAERVNRQQLDQNHIPGVRIQARKLKFKNNFEI